MAYQVGDETKSKILENARTLFYKNGFKSTSTNQIAEAAKVNQALIFYHFGNKSNLGLEVCNALTRDIRNQIAIKIYRKHEPFDAVVSTAVEYKVFTRFRRENENYRRFIKELCECNILLLTENYLGMALYKAVRKNYGKQLNEVDEKIAHYAITSIISGLIVTHNYGYIDCSYDYLCNKEIEMMLEILKFDADEIGRITTLAQEIFDSIEIEMGKNFQVY
ncbi:MAG: TetR/AcrR family transcriptional regulator [Anaerofustis sp.]